LVLLPAVLPCQPKELCCHGLLVLLLGLCQWQLLLLTLGQLGLLLLLLLLLLLQLLLLTLCQLGLLLLLPNAQQHVQMASQTPCP
jgi:hypothetical protein